MKRLTVLISILVMLSGCAAWDNFQNAALPQCRTAACAEAHGKSDPKDVRRTTEPPTIEEVGMFALEVGVYSAINATLWNNRHRGLDGHEAPDWWDGED